LRFEEFHFHTIRYRTNEKATLAFLHQWLLTNQLT